MLGLLIVQRVIPSASSHPKEVSALHLRLILEHFAASYLHAQAREDAQAAVALLLKELEAAEQRGGKGEPDLAARLAVAYLRLGEALMAQPAHEDRDCLRAFEVHLPM